MRCIIRHAFRIKRKRISMLFAFFFNAHKTCNSFREQAGPVQFPSVTSACGYAPACKFCWQFISYYTKLYEFRSLHSHCTRLINFILINYSQIPLRKNCIFTQNENFSFTANSTTMEDDDWGWWVFIEKHFFPLCSLCEGGWGWFLNNVARKHNLTHSFYQFSFNSF